MALTLHKLFNDLNFKNTFVDPQINNILNKSDPLQTDVLYFEVDFSFYTLLFLISSALCALSMSVMAGLESVLAKPMERKRLYIQRAEKGFAEPDPTSNVDRCNVTYKHDFCPGWKVVHCLHVTDLMAKGGLSLNH